MKTMNLTTPQQNIWNLQKYYSNTSISNLCGAIFFEEKFEKNLVNSGLNFLVRTHEGMRYQMKIENGHPVQYIKDYEEETFFYKVFQNKAEYEEYVEEFATQSFILVDSSLYRFTVFEINGRTGVLMCINHLIADAWSISLIADVVYAYCRNLSVQSMQAGSYQRFVERDANYLISGRYQGDKQFWNDKYDRVPTDSSVKIYKKSNINIASKRYTTRIDQSLMGKMEDFFLRYNVSAAVLFEAAIMTYLHCCLEHDRITIGVLTLNRKDRIDRSTIGMFISTLPLTIDFENISSGMQLCKVIMAGHYELFRHQSYPLAHILRDLRERHGYQGELYDVIVSFQNAKTSLGAMTQWYSNGYSEVPLQFHIDNRDRQSAYTITTEYQTELFEDTEIAFWVERILYVLEQLIHEPEKSITDYDILPPEECTYLLHKSEGKKARFNTTHCVSEIFKEEVRKHPNRRAVVAADRILTYKELDYIANSIAKFLLHNGVKPNDFVAFQVKRKAYLLAVMMGILKAGGAYLPIEMDYPEERKQYMICDSRASYVLTDEIVERVIKEQTGEEILIPVPIENNCYCIYTSGTTGKPKGVVITQKNICNFAKVEEDGIMNIFRQHHAQSIIGLASIGFDMFVTESLAALLNGMTILLADEKQMRFPYDFYQLFQKNRIDVLETTPTKMKLMLLDREGSVNLNQLKVIILGGEEVEQTLIQKVREYTNAAIYNFYGPTEATVWACCCHIKKEKFTLGKPLPNTQIYIVNNREGLQPIGIAGELCIAGEGVGKGYLNRSELTQERFIPNPFSTKENRHGKILYRTGDLASWNAEGEIEYLGRIDTQVKIRGLRMELGEVENCMLEFPGIYLAAATDQRDDKGRQYLVGYYAAGKAVDEKELRRHMLSTLPQYMIPNYFMLLPEMPMTATGKIDRKALPMPEIQKYEKPYRKPETQLEKELCGLLEQLFERRRIGIDEDFFEMGGDSLSAITYVTMAADKGITIALQNIFDYPTVNELCRYLSSEKKKRKELDKWEFKKYQDILVRNGIEEEGLRKKSLGNVFLTGSTGFLGVHVLDALMREKAEKVYCLVRPGSSQKIISRLRGVLKYYFGSIYEEEFGKRIIPVEGDLERENFSEYLPKDVQTVIHTAATVRHYGVYDYFYRVNTLGTKYIAQYAKKIGAKLIHISTLSVSGNDLTENFNVYQMTEEKEFNETSFYIGQPLDNVYIRSKFEAERMVYDAVLDGLDAKVIRVGNLTNRTSDFKFQPNYTQNAFLSRMKALMEFGRFPDYLLHLYAEFSPVDLTAEGIIKIAQYGERQSIFHLYNNKPVYFQRMLEILEHLGIIIHVTAGNEFDLALRQTRKNADTQYIYKAFQNDMNESGSLIYDTNIHVKNDATIQFLKKLGFEWIETDYDYLKGYIEYFRKLGYLKI